MARRKNFSSVLNNYIIIFLIIIFLIPIIIELGSRSDNSTNLTYNYTITSYDVILDVGLDNKIDVVEKITVYWKNDKQHGLLKYTPEWLQYTDKNGRTIKRKAVISDLKSTSDPYTVDWINKKARIKLGDPSKHVNLGEKTYVIAYTYDMGSDPYRGFDEFIFHAFGDYWGTAINNATIQVNMPKSIKEYNINFFTDKYRKENVNDCVDYKIVGNTLYASFNQDKYALIQESESSKLDSSLTVDIELPEGYFTKGSFNYGYISFVIILIIFGITIYTVFIWKKYGKNYAKPATTVEFYPPEGMSSAEVGYIYNERKSSKKLTISLIVQLASRGYIKIDDDKVKNEIVFTNLIPKVKPLMDISLITSNREVQMEKLKDVDETLTLKECGMMKYLFKDGNIKLLDCNLDTFDQVKERLVSNGYIKILSDKIRYSNNYEKVEWYNEQKLKHERELLDFYEKYPLTDLEKIVYDNLFEHEDKVVLSKHLTFYATFDEIDELLEQKFKDKIHDNVATKKMTISIFSTIIVMILCAISYFLIEDLDPSWNILYILSFVCIFINLFFIIFMRRKTEYGEKIKTQVKGFRKFLMTVEKPKLEALVEENPHYFYDILPYTYALNISKKWIKEFENISIPRLDMGSFDFSSDFAYYNLCNDVRYPDPVSHRTSYHSSSRSSSGSSGCSSCGGSSSSSRGGGCSSCGGGGSW